MKYVLKYRLYIEKHLEPTKRGGYVLFKNVPTLFIETFVHCGLKIYQILYHILSGNGFHILFVRSELPRQCLYISLSVLRTLSEISPNFELS